VGKWEMVRLGDVCEVVSGTTPSTSKPELWDGDVKWIAPAEINEDSYFIYDTVKHISEKAGLKTMPAGTVLLSSRAPIGKVAIAGSEMCCNQGFKNLVCSEKIYNRYLYRFLKNKTEYLNSLGRGATFKEISKPIVAQIEIPLPPLEVQRQIADVLDRASALIEKRKAQIDKLDLLVKSQFIEMFGDPVTNPKGWDVVALKTVCDVRDGTHDSPKYISEGFPLLTSKNFTKGYADFEDANYITEKDFQAINQRSKVDYGDIVMPMIGTIGSPVIVDTDRPFAIKNVALIKFNNSRIINVYLQALLSSYFLEYAIRQNNRGGTQKFIALGDIRRLSIPLPPISMQEDFIVFVHQVETQKSLLQQSLTKLELNYKSLMQKCFRGEIF